MATDNQIQEVRKNTDEYREDRFSDVYISDWIDAAGIFGASWNIWLKKAAEYTELVNASEAGATDDFGELQAKALRMVGVYEGLMSESGGGGIVPGVDIGRAKVKVIDRE